MRAMKQFVVFTVFIIQIEILFNAENLFKFPSGPAIIPREIKTLQEF